MKLASLKKHICLLFCLLIGLLMAACGGGDGDNSSGQVGTVSLSLTDNSALYNSVVLSIEKVGVVTNKSATTYYNSATISELPLTIDVLDLPGSATQFLGDIEVPLPDDGSEVCINQIRLVLAKDGNYVIEKGDPNLTRHDLKTPSGQQSGEKILVKDETFCISSEDDAVNVTLEFDPDTAIISKENSANPYQLKPTSLRIIQGSFFTAPESFIDGLVTVPIYNSVDGCGLFPTTPVVTVAAYNSAVLTTRTVTLADGPFKENGSCFYSGAFKLLLPDQGTYDLSATWDNFSAEMPSVAYNSSVLLELTKQ